jgi:hypothetical protein
VCVCVSVQEGYFAGSKVTMKVVDSSSDGNKAPVGVAEGGTMQLIAVSMDGIVKDGKLRSPISADNPGTNKPGSNAKQPLT